MFSRTPHILEIRNPCQADWEAMTGDSARRFCQHCQKHVHNLSAMPADEAERLICQSGGNLCVRFARDAAGSVVTLDYRTVGRRRWTWKVWTLIALAGALITGSVQALIFGKKSLPAPAGGPVMVQGGLAPPPAPTRPGASGGAAPVLMGEVNCPPPPPPSSSQH